LTFYIHLHHLQIMRKLSGAKDKLALRVHGLIVGSPEKKRADPAVLRALCTAYLPNGKSEVRACICHFPVTIPLFVNMKRSAPSRPCCARCAPPTCPMTRARLIGGFQCLRSKSDVPRAMPPACRRPA